MVTRFADRRAPFVEEEGKDRRCSLGRRDVRTGITGEEFAIVAEGISDLQMGRNGKEVWGKVRGLTSARRRLPLECAPNWASKGRDDIY